MTKEKEQSISDEAMDILTEAFNADSVTEVKSRLLDFTESMGVTAGLCFAVGRKKIVAACGAEDAGLKNRPAQIKTHRRSARKVKKTTPSRPSQANKRGPWKGTDICPDCGRSVQYRLVDGRKVLKKHSDPDGVPCGGLDPNLI